MNGDLPPSDGFQSDQVIDVEEFAKSLRIVPAGHKYKIRVDKERYVVIKPTITGREILALAQKTPEECLLHQRLRGGQTRTIEPNDKVDLTGEGPERFMTMKREAQEGFTDHRRVFRLSTGDEAFLSEKCPGWEAISEGGSQWILIRDFQLPAGYLPASVELAVQLSSGYPDAALDMAYFYPAIQRVSGQDIPATGPHALDGRQWQRWSRHRTTANPWVPGEDSLATHIAYIESFLVDEFRKRP